MPSSVDLLVIGGGPGGYVAAIAAAQLGRSVVLVDSNGEAGLGGVCVNVGCIPSKALIELAHATHGVANWSQRGMKVSAQPSVDMKDFQAWKSEVVSGLNGGVRQLLKTAGVEVRQGFFRFTRKDQGVLEFGEAPPTHIQFNNAIIATGSRPTMIKELPHDGNRILESSDVLALDTVPKAIAIVGAGYIGVELGTALAQLGSKVFMIEAGERILPALPAALVAPVARRLTEIGVEVRTKTTVVSDDGSALTVTTDGDACAARLQHAAWRDVDARGAGRPGERRRRAAGGGQQQRIQGERRRPRFWRCCSHLQAWRWRRGGVDVGDEWRVVQQARRW